MRFKEGQRGAYRHQSLIIYQPSLSPPMPNHLSTYLTTLLQNKTTPHIFKTTKPLIKEWGKEEKNGAGGVEMGGWKACGGVKMGCIMTPMPNHLSTCLSLPLNHKTTHKRVGACGEHTPKIKNHTKQCGKEERCGNGERCGDGEVERVMRLRRSEIEQKTTPMAWIRKLENNARGEQ